MFLIKLYALGEIKAYYVTPYTRSSNKNTPDLKSSWGLFIIHDCFQRGNRMAGEAEFLAPG